jgi:hypothetical protein
MSQFDVISNGWLESDEYINKKKALEKEMNSFKFEIDYSVFKKTEEEKEKLWNLKESNRRERVKFYGKDAHKYLNIPSRSIPEPIHIRN